MISLDPWDPLLGVLLLEDSDYVLNVLKLAGLSTGSFNLTTQEAYSHKTRKRAYDQRLVAVYAALDDEGRHRAAENLAQELTKSSHGLERVNEALKRIGWFFENGLLLPISPLEQEAFFPKGSEHDAYVHIRNILQEAKKALFIIDPYMDSSVFSLLASLSGRLDVKILTSKVPPDFALEATKFLAQHHSFSMEIRKTKDFHDRFIFVDETTCNLVGASLKDAGARSCTILSISDPRIIMFIYGYATQVWMTASTL